MTTIRTHCPICSSVVDVMAEEVLLLLGEEDVGTYRFDCPSCSIEVEKPADRTVVRALRIGGVPECRVTAGPVDAPPPAPPPLNELDVAAFSELLAGPDDVIWAALESSEA